MWLYLWLYTTDENETSQNLFEIILRKWKDILRLNNPIIFISRVKTDTIDSLDMGDEVAHWLCKYFSRSGLRLHFSAPSLEKRQCKLNKKLWLHPAKDGDMVSLIFFSSQRVQCFLSLSDSMLKLRWMKEREREKKKD